jgi:hypothetical protein
VVPFDPGVYVFELTVIEGGAPSLPAYAVIEASWPGASVPVASAIAPPVAAVGDTVLLDGTSSRDGEGDPLRYRWTQVAGPWVLLEEAGTATPAFVPVAPGAYAFELEVDDGAVRSAPSRVVIEVGPTPPRRTP